MPLELSGLFLECRPLALPSANKGPTAEYALEERVKVNTDCWSMEVLYGTWRATGKMDVHFVLAWAWKKDEAKLEKAKLSNL